MTLNVGHLVVITEFVSTQRRGGGTLRLRPSTTYAHVDHILEDADAGFYSMGYRWLVAFLVCFLRCLPQQRLDTVGDWFRHRDLSNNYIEIIEIFLQLLLNLHLPLKNY